MTKPKRELDNQEEKLVRELIRNPRLSDNKIAKRTGIPVMTVNRKRKKLEEEGILRYFAYLNTGEEGTGLFHARQLYLIKFKIGLTRENFFKTVMEDKQVREFNAQHVVESYLGEREGHLTLMLILEAKTEAELIEDFNGKIVPMLKRNLGEDCLREVTTAKISIPLRFHHNYLPLINMEKGILKKDWPDNWIFIQLI